MAKNILGAGQNPDQNNFEPGDRKSGLHGNENLKEDYLKSFRTVEEHNQVYKRMSGVSPATEKDFPEVFAYLKGLQNGDKKAESAEPSTSRSSENKTEKPVSKPVVRDQNGAIVCSEYNDLKNFIDKDKVKANKDGHISVDLGDGNHASFPEKDKTELRLASKFSGNVDITKDAEGNPEKITITNPTGISAYGSKFIGVGRFGKNVWDEAQVVNAEYKNIGNGKCQVTLTTNHKLTGVEKQAPRIKDISALKDLARYVGSVRGDGLIADAGVKKPY